MATAFNYDHLDRPIAVTQAADESFYPGDRVRVLTGYDGTARVGRYY